MDDYKPNSHKYKAEMAAKAEQETAEKKIKKVVTSPVKIKKKTEMTKLKDVFIAEDASNVKSYILMDVLVPAVKAAVQDIVTNGIAMLLYGESGRRKTGSSSGTSLVPYDRFSSRKDDSRREDNSRTRSMFDYDNIIYQTRWEAEEVLNKMDEILDTYRVVSVLDLYDLAGVSNNNSQTKKYGWTSITTAKVVHVRDGYMLQLPKALPID